MENNNIIIWVVIAVIIVLAGVRIFVIKDKPEISFLNKIEIFVYLVLIAAVSIFALISFLDLSPSKVQTKKQKSDSSSETSEEPKPSSKKKEENSGVLYSTIDGIKNLFYYIKGDIRRTKNSQGKTILVEHLGNSVYRDIKNQNDYYTCSIGGCVPEYDYGVIKAVDPSLDKNLFLTTNKNG